MHGAVERHFRLHRARDDRPDAAASMALQEHRHGLASAVAALAAELISYPGREHADPTLTQRAGWQFPLWLSEDKLAERPPPQWAVRQVAENADRPLRRGSRGDCPGTDMRAERRLSARLSALCAPLEIPATTAQSGGEAVCLCVGSLAVNVLSCRAQ